MLNFGKGPTLRDVSPWLRDTAERRRILDVLERNSVIEGLPPFDEQTRRHILAQLQELNRSISEFVTVGREKVSGTFVESFLTTFLFSLTSAAPQPTSSLRRRCIS
jgi:hypothetical protein